jgi:signal transduction histidine kinase/ActR/RegA family two-component response regulator
MNSLVSLYDRWRLVLIGVSVGLLIVGSLIIAGFDQRQYTRRATETATVQARILASTVTAALSFGDHEALREYVGALRADQNVEAVGVFDSRGRLAASFTRAKLADSLAHVKMPSHTPNQVIVLEPVSQDGIRLGAVYLRDRTEPLLTRLGRYIAPGLLVMMASMMFLVMGLDARRLRRANRALESEIKERAKAEIALRQSQKMEAIGRLTGGIAHDFNNMLAIVIGSLDLLLRGKLDSGERTQRLAEQARQGAQRAAALTQRLLAFARQQPLKPTSADINRNIQDIAALLQRTLGESIQIETVSSAGLWRAHIDLSQLETAIVNLAINARDAMPEGGKLTIEASNTYLDRAYAESQIEVAPGQYVMVAVSDTGTGIPPELHEQIFEPFFTTKPTGMGTGLGLSQVQGFIRQSNGHIRIYSEVGVGTTVKLYLPRSTTLPTLGEAKATPAQASGRRNLSILVVEDEDGVRNFVVEALSDLGYEVLAAGSAQAALEILETHPEVAILLTDVVMPETNGRELSRLALEMRPSLLVVFMTGYTRNAIVHNGVLDVGARLINKPFTIAQLGSELEAAVADQTLT